jgi:hypothetical protein
MVILTLQFLREIGETPAITPNEVLGALYEAHDGLQPDVLADAVLRFRTGADPNALLPPTPQAVVQNQDDRRQVREVLAYLLTAEKCICPTTTLLGDSFITLATEIDDLLHVPHVVAATAPDQGVSQDLLEGEVYEEARRVRRRNPKLRTEALAVHGHLCAVCLESFQTLGDLRDRPLDVHHISPLAESTGPRLVGVADVLVVCAVCHRVIHSRKPMLTVSEARRLLGLEE